MQDAFVIILSLFAVIALIFATYYAARWLNKRVKFSNNSMFKVHDRVNLGTDKAIIIASVGDKYMLLGITQGNISKIADLEKEDIENLIKQNASNDRIPFAQAFSKVLLDFNKKRGGEGNDKE